MGTTSYRSVIGIDPGTITGWALFLDGSLLEAGTVKAEALLNLPFFTGSTIVIIEVPRVYPRGGKGDPNDLIDLAVLAGTIKGWYASRGAHTALVTPRAWKGSTPKAIHNKRVLKALRPEERAKLPRRPRARTFDHNMLDAVGLALHQLEREGQR